MTADNGYTPGYGPENAFDGDLLNTFMRCAQGFGYTFTIPDGVDVQSVGVYMLGTSTYNGEVRFSNESGGVLSTQYVQTGGVELLRFANSFIKTVYFYGYGGLLTSSGPTVYGITLNDELLISGDATPTGTVGSIAGTVVTLSTSSGTWIDGDEVTGPEKQPFRSLTEEELTEQTIKFASYKNRTAVHQGEQAMAQRDSLLRSCRKGASTLLMCWTPKQSEAVVRKPTKASRCPSPTRRGHWLRTSVGPSSSSCT